MFIAVVCAKTISAEETTILPRQVQRVPKTAKTTTTSSTTTTEKPTVLRRIATHPPWPSDVTTTKPIRIATHPPWPGDVTSKPARVATHPPWPGESGGHKRATHAPFPYRDQYGMSTEDQHMFPHRSKYSPYVYGSSSGSQNAKKKNVLSVFDRETVNSWAKDIVAYLTAPFMMPSAIGNAISNVPSGLETETLWGRIAKSLKSALNRKSGEDRNENTAGTNNNNNVLKRMKKKLVPNVAQSIASLLPKRFQRNSSASSSSSPKSSSSSTSPSDSKKKSVDKKFRDIFVSRLLDFLRAVKIHPIKEQNAARSKSSASSSSSSVSLQSSQKSSSSTDSHHWMSFDFAEWIPFAAGHRIVVTKHRSGIEVLCTTSCIQLPLPFLSFSITVLSIKAAKLSYNTFLPPLVESLLHPSRREDPAEGFAFLSSSRDSL